MTDIINCICFHFTGNIFGQQEAKPGKALEQYTVDLTQLAKDNKLDPVIGRYEEIRRCIQILARRTKNNPGEFKNVVIVGTLQTCDRVC